MRQASISTVHAPHPTKPDGSDDTDRYYRRTVSTLWSDAWFPAVAINASFFGDYAWALPTNLSFPFKQGGTLLTKGTDCASHRGYVKNLMFWWDRQYAAINDMSCSTTDFAKLTEYGSAPHIVTVLDPSFPIDRSIDTTNRTMVGLYDSDNNSLYETVLISVSKNATRTDARQHLLNFGLDSSQIVMLDGGGSTQLLINGDVKVTTNPPPTRPVPNALIVYAY
jgi:hypothetical protein